MSNSSEKSKAAWLDQNQYPFPSRFCQVDGGAMHYVDEGQGEPILFVHGFPTWSFMWRGLINDLSVKHRCIAMDHIGFGLSDKPEHWSYTPEAHARNYRKLLDHLGISTFSLVVHDFGGPIALAHALDFPGRINRICAINSFMWSVKSDEHFVKFDHKVNGPIGKMALTATPIGLNKMLHDMVEMKQKVSDKIYPQYTGPFHKASDRQGPYGLAKGYIGSSQWLYDLWVRKEAIADKPVQVIWGMKDKLFTIEQLNKWRHYWPNADIVTFPESGHLVAEEQARDFEAAVYMFLDGHSELAGVTKAIHADF
ncbi:MAG: alpha/beta fold hydrolase [Chlorobia bacterium]|nr:alpha/beta fold hydrolase [Fimbriimonadaceae bacterium]